MTYAYDAAEFLETEEERAQYLKSELESGDDKYIREAVINIMNSRMVSDLVDMTGLSRSSVCRVLNGEDAPPHDDLKKIARAFGYDKIPARESEKASL